MIKSSEYLYLIKHLECVMIVMSQHFMVNVYLGPLQTASQSTIILLDHWTITPV